VKIMPFCYNRLLEITLKVKDIDDIKAEIRSVLNDSPKTE
jgi:hypothetical protein